MLRFIVFLPGLFLLFAFVACDGGDPDGGVEIDCEENPTHPDCDPDPDPENAGTLYVQDFDELTAIDMATRTAEDLVEGVRATYSVEGGSVNEIAHLDEGLVSEPGMLQVYDATDRSLKTSWQWDDYELIDFWFFEISPDGELFAAGVGYGSDAAFLEVRDRDGELVARLRTVDIPISGSEADVLNWTWTPDSDLLVTIESAYSDVLDEGAALAVIDRDDLLDGDDSFSPQVIKTMDRSDPQPPKYHVAVSPDGEFIAYVDKSGGNEQVLVMPFELEAAAHPVAHAPEGLGRIAFSPDSDALAISANSIADDFNRTFVVPNHENDSILLEPANEYELLVDNFRVGSRRTLDWTD